MSGSVKGEWCKDLEDDSVGTRIGGTLGVRGPLLLVLGRMSYTPKSKLPIELGIGGKENTICHARRRNIHKHRPPEPLNQPSVTNNTE